MKNIYLISLIILIVVGLNIGLIGLFGIDMLGMIVRGGAFTRIINIIIGVAAALVAFNKIKVKD